MKIHTDLQDLSFQYPIVSFGIYDGVHRGHKKIIARIKELASHHKGESVLITFWPHPRFILNNNTSSLLLLSTLDEKLYLLEKEGVDHLLIIPFTKDFSELSSCDFIKKYLIDLINARHLVIGFNQHFGKKRQGNFENIKSCAAQYHFTVEQLTAETSGETIISSSKIREALLNGDVAKASDFLGHTYFISGTVTGGKKIGRELGFPTANVTINEEKRLIPHDGVYAVFVKIEGEMHKGMLNIGVKPTIQGSNPTKTIEVHIFNFNEDIYNKNITLYFKERLRDEKKFESIDLLVKQLNKDKETALACLS